MASVRITSFLLMLVLFSLQQSSSCAQIGHAREEKLVLDKDGVEVLIAGGSSSEVQKVLHDGIPSTADVVRDIDRGIEERKLKLRKFLGQGTAKEVTSRQDQNASKLPQASSLEYMEDQEARGGTTRPIRVSILRKMMVYPPDSRPVHCDAMRSSKCPSSQEPYDEGSLQNLDAQKEATESAHEIMALTNRDYHGAGRHPPPINNGHPLSQHHKP
ncbi:hypothetical protein NL676_029229 [Syzygium grande]|nr:hypothetical protein NL676_029229 [Syzygium grande]